MNILVTGANGQLGSEIRCLAPSSAHRFIFTDVAGPCDQLLDISNGEAVRALVRDCVIDVVVNCAGYTDVEGAEDHREKAELLNATAVGNLAAAMRETGGLVVHISTDYVFGKVPAGVPLQEDAPCAPMSVYGCTKLQGEQVLRSSGARFIIVRTAWMYSPYGKNFLKTLLRLTAEKPAIQVVSDQVGTPTYAGDLARAILQMVEKPWQEGLYHFTNEGFCSWYDFACAIARLSGHDKCEIRPCTSADYPTKAVRPAWSVLDKSKVKKTFGLSIAPWEEALERCMSQLTL